MCDDGAVLAQPRLSRRALLRAGGLLAAAAVLGIPAPAAAARLASADGPVLGAGPVRRRAAWGADLPPTGPLDAEAPEDVRFLLVHHTASSNDYAAADVPDLLGAFYRFHTADRGWADVAYNFFVDRYGSVWEGRQGSLEAPIKGDATGGSQGFALLAAFIGDHTDTEPTEPARAAMVDLLAWLAAGYGIDPEGETAFTSRGSNRWPAGERVETATIAGHRDMSQTACPGDAGYALVRGALPGLVAARLAAAPPEPTPEPTAEPAPTAEPDPSDDAAVVPGTEPGATEAPAPATEPPLASGSAPAEGGGVPVTGIAAGALAASAAAVTAEVARRRRQ